MLAAAAAPDSLGERNLVRGDGDDFCGGGSGDLDGGGKEQALGAGSLCRGDNISGNGSTRRSLSHKDDSDFLSPLLCFVRSDLLEAFVVTTEEEAKACRDVDRRLRKGGRGTLEEFFGRVGLKCVHCSAAGAAPPTPSSSSSTSYWQPRAGSKGAVSYPPSIRLVYQGVRNWQRYHAATCPSMPEDVKAKYLALKAASAAKRGRSKGGIAAYWEECCRKMGMVDAEIGIRLRNGHFLDSDSDAPAETVAAGAGGSTLTMSRIDINTVSPNPEVGDAEEDRTMPDAASRKVLVPGPHERDDEDQHQILQSEEFQSKEQTNMLSSEASSQPSPQSALDPHISEAGSACVGTLAIQQDGNFSATPVEEKDLKSCSPGLQAILPNEPKPDQGGSPWLIPPETETEIILTDAERGNSPSLDKPSLESVQWTRDITSPAPSGDALLDKLKLAESIVQAVGQIHQEFDGGEKKSEGFDMRYLGEELYELFAERYPFQEEEEEEEDLGETEEKEPAEEGLEPEEGGPQRRPKREKLREGKGYVPLNEIGLPPALCNLVSALLDYENKGLSVYESIQDVEEDLRLMAAMPDRFLLQAPNGYLETTSTALFGREKEVARLLEAYDETTNSATSVGRNRIVLVAGCSGTGKSSLVYSVRDRLVEKGARFISGKFDAMRQLGPFTAIVSALDDYCDMLAHDLGRIDHARDAITAAIGEEGSALLATLIPNLGKVVKDVVNSPAAWNPTIDRVGTQRVIFLVRMLLRATCSRAHPVVLFLDDLQWADEVSLELMQGLVVDVGIEGLLVIGCYRDNEVNAGHLLTAYLDNIRISKSVDTIPIKVSNLDLESVNALVSVVLCATPRATRHLAEAALQKTGGNPLFVLQFLGSLRDEALLRFSLMSRQWEWDIDKIRDKSITDNVVELMTAKLLRLAPEVQQTLSIAAAFGAQCQEEIFQVVDRVPDRVLSSIAALDIAVTEGLVVKKGSVYRFSHDQIQHAAYLLIPELVREEFHLKVGRWLCQWSSAEEMDTYLFVVVDQLYRGSSLIIDHDEQLYLARLNLLAGQKAYESYAFLPAAAYLKAGIGLLAEDDWIVHRDLCFDLYNSAAETQYILREFDVMTNHWEEVLRRANGVQEKMRAFYSLVLCQGAHRNAKDALGLIKIVNNQLGEPLPEVVTEEIVMQELVATQTMISEKTEDDLFHLEMMQDERKREVMKFFDHVMFGLLLHWAEYFPVVACRMVRLSLQHGVCSQSAVGFACYGMVLIGGLKDLSGGYRFGKLALATQKKFPGKENLAKVHSFVYGYVNNWVEPIQSSLPFLKDVSHVGLGIGNIECGVFGSMMYLTASLHAGASLLPLMEEMKSLTALMLHYRQYEGHTASKSMEQAILNLLGQSDDPIKFIRDEHEENHALNNAEDSVTSQFSAPDAMTKLYRMWLEYLFGEYDLAWETREENQGIEEWAGAWFPVVCMFSFYSGLTAMAMARNKGESKYADTINRTHEQMKVWAASTSWNCQHKLELMDAEYAYLKGDFAGAAEAYSTAVDTAAKHKFIHEEALASERAGLFYSETGMHDAASKMYVRAHNCYIKWGASSKAAQVEEKYDLLIS